MQYKGPEPYVSVESCKNFHKVLKFLQDKNALDIIWNTVKSSSFKGQASQLI